MVVQEETGMRNFFPQTKFLKHLTLKLKRLFKENKALPDLERCRNIIDVAEGLYDTYNDNVNWTQGNHNYVMQATL